MDHPPPSPLPGCGPSANGHTAPPAARPRRFPQSQGYSATCCILGPIMPGVRSGMLLLLVSFSTSACRELPWLKAKLGSDERPAFA